MEGIRVVGGKPGEEPNAAAAAAVRRVRGLERDLGGVGVVRGVWPPRTMELRDVSPQDPAKPWENARRVVERPGTVRGAHHRPLNNVLRVRFGREDPASAADEAHALVSQ